MSEGIVVNVPGVGAVNFPAGMSDTDIEEAIKTKILPQAKGAGAVSGPNDVVGSFAGGMARGGTLGYADELGAGIRALFPSFSNMAMSAPTLKRDESIGGGNEPAPQTVSTAPTIGGRYDEELARLRAQAKADQEAHPVAVGAGQLIGNVGAGGAVLPGIGIGQSVIHNAARLGLAGAGLGAVQGFGEGEGGFANRATNAGVGAGLGAVGGAAVPIAGAIGSKVVEAAGVPALRKLAAMLESVAPKVTPKSLSSAAPEGGQVAADSVATRLADALTGKADTIEQKAALHDINRYMLTQKSTPESLQSGLNELGPQGMLADLGPSMLGATNAARLQSPEIKNLAQTLMGNRAKQYGPMLTEAAGAKEVPSMHEAAKMFGTDERNIGAYARNVGTDLYGKMRAGGLNTSPEMQKIIEETPSVRNAIEQIQADYAEQGKIPSPIELMDKVKQKLNKTAEAKFNSGVAVDKSLVGNTADTFEKAFWTANPAAETASHGYRNANELRDYIDAGRRFMSEGTAPGQVDVSSSAIRDKLAESALRGSQYAPGAYTLGVQNAVRSAAETNPTNLARGITPEKTGIIDKLTQALGPEAANKVLGAANSVRTFQKTANTLTGGSSTVPNLADVAAMGNARFNLGKSGITERITEHAKDIMSHLEEPSDATLKKIGEMLMTPNAAENRDTIEALKALHAAHAKTAGSRAAAGSSIFNQEGR
jgi:hypothetical protein